MECRNTMRGTAGMKEEVERYLSPLLLVFRDI